MAFRQLLSACEYTTSYSIVISLLE